MFKYILLVLLYSSLIAASSLSGTIKIDNNSKAKGILYIFAKNQNSKMPVVVKRIAKPVFPQKFTLTEADKMIKRIPFKGPFIVTARLSPSGGVMDKTGLEISSKELVELGASGINLTLK